MLEQTINAIDSGQFNGYNVCLIEVPIGFGQLVKAQLNMVASYVLPTRSFQIMNEQEDGFEFVGVLYTGTQSELDKFLKIIKKQYDVVTY